MKSAEQVISWVLEAIKRERKLQEYGLLFVIKFDLKDLTSKDPNSPSIEDARKVVYLLEKKHKALEIADIDNPKEREHHEKNALTYRPARGTATRFMLEINRKKFDEVYTEYLRVSTHTADGKVLECGLLKINLDQGVIRYNDKMPAEISPDDKKIRFLVFLMENKKVVEYAEIAKKLDVNWWQEGLTNKDVARDVQFLRRDLATFLRDEVSMTNREIQKMIINKKNIGYKLRCGK